jgi:hypothetical protein
MSFTPLLAFAPSLAHFPQLPAGALIARLAGFAKPMHVFVAFLAPILLRARRHGGAGDQEHRSRKDSRHHDFASVERRNAAFVGEFFSNPLNPV